MKDDQKSHRLGEAYVPFVSWESNPTRLDYLQGAMYDFDDRMPKASFEQHAEAIKCLNKWVSMASIHIHENEPYIPDFVEVSPDFALLETLDPDDPEHEEKFDRRTLLVTLELALRIVESIYDNEKIPWAEGGHQKWLKSAAVRLLLHSQ